MENIEKKESEKAITDCVKKLKDVSKGITDEALSPVMAALRPKFEDLLDGKKRTWAKDKDRMMDNCRYMATFAEFFALGEGAITTQHLSAALAMVKVKCRVGAPDPETTANPFIVYCDGGFLAEGAAKAEAMVKELLDGKHI